MDRQRITRASHRDRLYRKAFFALVEAYNQMKVTIGSAPAIDYFQSQLGKAKYKCDISSLRCVDFVADFEKCVKDALNAEQQAFFKSHYVGKPDQSARSDNNMMLMQKELGKLFVGRRLWPLSTYFAGERA